MRKYDAWFWPCLGLSAVMLLSAYRIRQGDMQSALLIMLLGGIVIAMLLYWPIQKAKEEKEKRKEQLQSDYSQMITLLSLYMTAGLSLRSSWEKMIRQYEMERNQGGPARVVYEEMRLTWRAIRGGEYEERAYSSFGRRCGTAEYLRLGGLLETYVQQGNKELLQRLEQEAAASLSLALQQVKKKGEQTGTKLLMPLLLLFGISLLLIMIPAFMSMQTNI